MARYFGIDSHEQDKVTASGSFYAAKKIRLMLKSTQAAGDAGSRRKVPQERHKQLWNSNEGEITSHQERLGVSLSQF